MAKFHGKGGSITWAGSGFESKALILSWSCEVTADVAELTDMGDTWKGYLPGFKDWTATVEVLADETQGVASLGEMNGADYYALKLEMVDAGDHLTGDALNTNISYAVDMNDVGKCTLTFQGSGELSYAAA